MGIQRLGETSGGGSGTAQLTLPEAQRITDKRGELDGISVEAAPGVSLAELSQRIDDVLPPRLVVETGQQAAARQAQDIKDDLKFFRVMLLVFGGVALLVGSFLIFNIFSITVAQRIREFGLLRTLGASRPQILGGTVLEAALLGVLGAGLGLPAGIGFAAALNAVFKSFGIDLPEHRHGDRDAHDRGGAGGGHRRDAGRGAGAGAAGRRGSRRWPRCWRPSCPRAAPAGGSSRRSPPCSSSPGSG